MQYLNDLSQILDNQLLTNFSLVVQREREVISDLIAHLAELEIRKLYAAQAYPSLFSYLTEKYRYSPGAAYRRIQAARLYQRFPEILKLLEEGKLSLMTISLIEPHVKQDSDQTLIEKAIGKSQREVEDLLSDICAKKVQFKDVIRKLPLRDQGRKEDDKNHGDPMPLLRVGSASTEGLAEIPRADALGMTRVTSSAGSKSEEQEVRKVKIEFVADEVLAEKIERAKQVLRHKYPKGARLEEIFNQALEDLLEKRDVEKKIARKKKRSKKTFKMNSRQKGIPEEAKDQSQKDLTPEVKKPEQNKIQTRYIPEAVKLEVWKRDEGRCSYISPDGMRCSEKGALELDHQMPWSLGGDSSVENVRLLCRSHNAWRVGFMK